MEIAEADGRHQASMSTEDRVRAIVADFHENAGLANKNHMDEDKVRSIINLICGSCPDPGIRKMLSLGWKNHVPNERVLEISLPFLCSYDVFTVYLSYTFLFL